MTSSLFTRTLRVAGLTAVVAAATGAARLHNHLEKSFPAANDTLATSPTQIRVWYAEPAIPRLSGLALWTAGADSTRIPLGAVAATDTNVSVAAPVPAPLAAGTYRVRWRTASEDGHVIRGAYDFVVQP